VIGYGKSNAEGIIVSFSTNERKGWSCTAIKENTKTFLEASRDGDVKTNAEKTKYMIISLHTNSG
jgi:hypothetical protein